MNIPADVPKEKKREYEKNFNDATRNSGNVMLFAGDQRFEHLNYDFVGEGVSKNDADPIHFFNIASHAKIGLFGVQLGLIAKYGEDFPDIQYLVKLNSKSNLVKTAQRDPLSTALYDVEQVVAFKQQSGLKILGIGYTLYLGSENEHIMVREAAQAILKAHQNGLLAIVWIYPRGKDNIYILIFV